MPPSEHASGPARIPDDAWRPRRWPLPVGEPNDRIDPLAWVAIAVVVVYNPISNELVPAPAYVPANLAVAALVMWLAHRSGVSPSLLGIDRRILRGAALGLAISAVAVACVTLAALLPATRQYFVDQRFIGVGIAEAAYQTLVRIPLGTAVVEELIFRGAIFGILLTRFTVVRAALISSALFGLWHVIPTLDALDVNPAGNVLGTLSGVVGGVLVTFVAGLAFVWLRLRGRGLAAPILVHLSLNAAAYAAGWWVVNG